MLIPRWLPARCARAALLSIATTAAMLTVAGQAAALPSNCAQAAFTVTCSFVYTGGEQQFKVPAAVTSMQVSAVGGRGGDSSLGSFGYQTGGRGGLGGTASAPVSVFAGETLYVEVGGDGLAGNHGAWNGGGAEGAGSRSYQAGAGGGASDVRTASCGAGCANGGGMGSLVSRLVVAGGGAGGGEVGETEGIESRFPGGSGGAAEEAGSAGSDTDPEANALGGSGGLPGSVSGFGAGGGRGVSLGGSHDGEDGQPGALGRGGGGGIAAEGRNGAGGGGGGGYYGGGGGGGGAAGPEQSEWAAGGGAGGGSSYAPGGAVGIGPEGTSASVRFSYTVPAVAVSAPTTFGTQPQGTLSGPQALTITNEGEGALDLSALTFSGADAGDFLIGSDGCLGQLEPGESCDITVAFAPQSQGARTATLQIASNDPNGRAMVPLEGTGGALPQGARGAPGAEGAGGAAGPAGGEGARGASGPIGASGPGGATGPAGATGASGSLGHLAVMTCATTHSAAIRSGGRGHLLRRIRCTEVGTVTTATLPDEGAAQRVKLVRGGRAYASGMSVAMRRGHATLVLTGSLPIAPGHYTLVLTHRRGGRWVTLREAMTIATSR